MPSKQRWPWEAQGVIPAHQAAQAQRSHRANRWLTIFLPLLVSGLGLLALAVWTAIGASNTAVNQAASVITIYAALLCMVSGLPVFAILIGLIILMHRAQKGTPELAKQAFRALQTTQGALRTIADKSTEPFIRGRVMLAAWRAAWHTLRKGGHP